MCKIAGLPVKASLPKSRPAAAQHQQEDWDEYEEEDEDDLKDQSAPGDEDWRSMLQGITRYDPHKYAC